jgi:hypothetical protein
LRPRTWNERPRKFLFRMRFTTIMTLKVCDSTGGLVRSGDPVHQRTLGIVSAATVGAGTLGFALSKTVDASCPFRTFGFACPGCGCSRAVESLFRHGPIEMFRDQPTATAFLVFVGFALIWSVVGYLYRRRAILLFAKYSYFVLGLLLLAASTNWIYQIAKS